MPVPAVAMHRFWTMLAYYHGQTWNAAEPARSLGVAEPTVRRYLDILTGVFMIRQLPPWHANLKKRQVKAPKILSFAKNQVDSLLRECRARSATVVLPSSRPEQWRAELLATQPGVSRYDILARFSPDGHKDRLGAAMSYDRCHETTDGEHRCYAARLSYRW